MTFKASIAPNPRSVIVSLGGDDNLSGQTLETAKATLTAAVEFVNALVPAPSVDNPASIMVSGAGVFTDNVVLPDGVQFDGSESFNFPLTGDAFVLPSRATFKTTSAGATAPGTTAFVIQDKVALGLESKAGVALGVGCTVVKVLGSSDNIFVTISRMDLSGDGSVGILDQTSNGASEIYNINEAIVNADNTTIFRYDPVTSTSEASLNAGSFIEIGTRSGTKAIEVLNGALSVIINEVDSETAIFVAAGATLNIAGNKCSGAIIVEAGGVLNINFQTQTGTLTLDGEVNGFINGNTYGNPNTNSSSLSFGGVITEGTLNTQINIASGTGAIYDYTIPEDVGVFGVSWDAFVDVDLEFAATDLFSFITINRDGGVTQFGPNSLGFVNRRDFIVLGTVTHPAGVFQASNRNSVSSRETHSQFLDLLDALGVIKASGLVVQPNADLTFDKTAGILMSPGAGNAQGNRAENAVTLAAESPTVFGQFLGLTENTSAAAQTSVDPANFDDGSGAPVPVGGGGNSSTIQYIFQFPLDGSVLVQYGQTVYTDLADALANADTDNPIIPFFIRQDALLVARIAIEKGATDLTNEAEAVFLAGAKFGVDITGGSGGSGAGGGDVFGPASSSVDEIATYLDVTGKIIEAVSDVSVSSGTIRRIGTNLDLRFMPNGVGKVRMGGGAILSNFGASNVVGATAFSVASPLGFSATIHYEHDGALAGESGYRFVDDAIVLIDTVTLKGVFIETDGQISLGLKDTNPDFSVIIGGDEKPFGLPSLTTANEAALPNRQRMLHYNSVLDAVRFNDGTGFESLLSGPDEAAVGEIPTFAIIAGHKLQAVSDISALSGILERMTAGQPLWLRVDSSGEHIIQGRHDDLTGVNSLTNITAAITSNSTNGLAFVSLGNNSQFIEFVKNGLSRGALINNRDRNSVGISSGPDANGNTIYVETLEDDTCTMMVAKVGVGQPASANDMVVSYANNSGGVGLPSFTTAQRDAKTFEASAEIWNTDTLISERYDGTSWWQSGGKIESCIVSTFQNTTPTLIIMLDSYVRARLGAGQIITNNKNFSLGTDGAIYNGNLYRGVCTITFDYSIPQSLANTKGYAFTIGRNGTPFTNSLHENNDVLNSGEFVRGSCQTLIELATGAEVTLRVKQIVGTLEDDITFRNVQITFS